MRENETYYVGNRCYASMVERAEKIMETGVKQKDALHVACAVYADCAYLLTTDDRLLKYACNEIQIVTPCEFVRRLEEENV